MPVPSLKLPPTSRRDEAQITKLFGSLGLPVDKLRHRIRNWSVERLTGALVRRTGAPMRRNIAARQPTAAMRDRDLIVSVLLEEYLKSAPGPWSGALECVAGTILQARCGLETKVLEPYLGTHLRWLSQLKGEQVDEFITEALKINCSIYSRYNFSLVQLALLGQLSVSQMVRCLPYMDLSDLEHISKSAPGASLVLNAVAELYLAPTGVMGRQIGLRDIQELLRKIPKNMHVKAETYAMMGQYVFDSSYEGSAQHMVLRSVFLYDTRTTRADVEKLIGLHRDSGEGELDFLYTCLDTPQAIKIIGNKSMMIRADVLEILGSGRQEDEAFALHCVKVFKRWGWAINLLCENPLTHPQVWLEVITDLSNDKNHSADDLARALVNIGVPPCVVPRSVLARILARAQAPVRAELFGAIGRPTSQRVGPDGARII